MCKIEQSPNTWGEPVQAIFPDHQPCLKRKYEDSIEEIGAMEDGGVGFYAKRRCFTPMEAGGNEQEHDLNFPIPGEKGLPCLVKVCMLFSLVLV